MASIADLVRMMLGGNGGQPRYEDRSQPVMAGGGMVRSGTGGPVTSRYGQAAPIENRPLVDMVRAALQASAPQEVTDQQLEAAFRNRRADLPPMLPDEYGVEARPAPRGMYWQPEGTALDDGIESRPMPENFYWQPEGQELPAPEPAPIFNPHMPNLPWRASSRLGGKVQPWAPTSLFDTR